MVFQSDNAIFMIFESVFLNTEGVMAHIFGDDVKFMNNLRFPRSHILTQLLKGLHYIGFELIDAFPKEMEILLKEMKILFRCRCG